MARKLNYPSQQQPNLSPGEMGAMVADFNELRRQTVPRTDDEFEDRIQWFFQWCADHDRRPGVELLALALGTTRQQLWRWQQRDDRRGVAITQAKQTIISMIEQWGQTGKINPIPMIFLLKNHAAYRDSVNIETTSHGMLSANLTPDQIRQRIEQDIPIDTDFEITDQEGE